MALDIKPIKISLDFYNRNIVCVNAKQLDSKSRYIDVTFTNQGKKITLDHSSVSVIIRYKKSDGYYCFNNAVEITDDGTALFELTQQMLAVDGKSIADIMVINSSGVNVENISDINDIYDLNVSIISTMSFYINTESIAIDNAVVESSYEYDALTTAIATTASIESHMKNLEQELLEAEEQRVVADIERENKLKQKADKNNTVLTGSLSMGRKAGTTIGNNSTALGINVDASGDYSCCEGDNTTSSGIASHAEGGSCIASGDWSHAEGCNASGSEQKTTASGIGAHAEGRSTQATQEGAHSEGMLTQAKAYASHAEGKETIAGNANYHTGAHAEGFKSQSLNTSAHAEGYNTRAIGDASHSEGNGTSAEGQNSHAEGNDTLAKGVNSHAEGKFTKALGEGSHAEGFFSREMYLEIVDGQEGYRLLDQDKSNLPNWLNGYYLEVGIESNIETGGMPLYGFGLYDASDKTTLKATITKTYTVQTDDGYDLYAILDTDLSEEITANPDRGFYVYYGKADGKGAHVEGGGIAIGTCAHAEGSMTWAAHQSHAEGHMSAAMNTGSHAEGIRTRARGKASHSEGYNTFSDGARSHVQGNGTIAKSDDQDVIGKYNIPDNENKYAHIIGGGDSDSDRKNIHTVDWDGKAEYSSDVVANVEDGKTPVSLIETNDLIKNHKHKPYMKVLWKGFIKDSWSGETFSIPKECYHHVLSNGEPNTVTLLVEGYRFGDSGNYGGYATLVSLSLESAYDSYSPLRGSSGVYVYTTSFTEGIFDGIYFNLNKVPTTNYSECKFETADFSSSLVAITCISALIPEEV